MTDALGWRMKFGVIAPSTNTVVQPEYDMMRPRGVTNHFARIHIPNDPLRGDADFETLIDRVRGELLAAVDRVMTCEPDHLIMGMSSETFWDGLDGSERLRERIEAHAGIAVTMGSEASRRALERYGDIKRIGVVTPYMPVADQQVRRFFTDCGFEVVRLVGLKCASPVLIVHVGERNCVTRCSQSTDRTSKQSSRSVPIWQWRNSLPRPSYGSTNRYWRSTRRRIGGRCAAMASPTRSTASGRCCAIISGGGAAGQRTPRSECRAVIR
jgi:maleate isomerase